MSFDPKYIVTANMAADLAAIDAARFSMADLPVTAKMLASLRETARISSTHHSTAIEGNQLSFEEVKETLQGSHFPHREKDEKEVRNYYKALNHIDILVQKTGPIQEKDVQLLHGLSFLGKNRLTPYRDGQNVIRSGKLVVYIPPKSGEVPTLMSNLFNWINEMVSKGLPIPLIAGLAHYQFATIHPYFDGNGRTARLLVTLILHKYGYGLNGIYSLEEYYAKNLDAYYQALTIGTDEDYYDGNRADADITPFLAYFLQGMANAFKKVTSQAHFEKSAGASDQSSVLRKLNFQQKQILKLFITSREITAKNVASFFQLNDRQARHLCNKWVSEDFFEIADPAPKTRSYRLNDKYEALIQTQL